MRRKVEPLLCELHAHTRWSDGEFALPDLIDLYGRNGFDVLAVTPPRVRVELAEQGLDLPAHARSECARARRPWAERW